MTLTTYWNEKLGQFPAHSETLSIREYFVNEFYQRLFTLSCTVNGSAMLKTETTAEKGSATELAILKLMNKMNFNYINERESNVSLRKFPFNSERKRMSTVIQLDGKQIILLKGAS